ncbi:hypothetical protein E3P91_04094 [Wallemia ichthyophaga]|nr:hypothetical protein E3P91_04094 [Wallemia ichthyophaga]
MEDEIMDLYKSTLPSAAVINKRNDLITRVSSTISNKYGSNYAVQCFGSTCYQVDSASSDLDLVMTDRHRPNGFDPSVDMDTLPSAYNPNNVAKTLLNHNFNQVQPIFAAVPIVKFSDSKSNLQCDLNANNLFGIRNSLLIKAYLDLSPIARPVVLAVKNWAKLRGLNDSAGQYGPTTLSSYTLILMVISFLQVVGHLPNLQDPDQIRAAGLQEQRLWVRPPTKRPKDLKKERSRSDNSNTNTNSQSVSPPTSNVRVSFDTTFVEAPLRNFVPSPLSLSTALSGFFYYYSTRSNKIDNDYWRVSGPFNYETSIISIKHGGFLPRDDLFVDPYSGSVSGGGGESESGANKDKNTNNIQPSQPLQWREQLLVTQDPFIVTRNTSTNVRSGTSSHIIEEFARAYELVSCGKSYSELCEKRTTAFQGEPGPGSFRRPLRKMVSRRKKSGGKQPADGQESKESEGSRDAKVTKDATEKDSKADKDKDKVDKEKREAAIKRKRNARKKALSKSKSASGNTGADTGATPAKISA